MKEMLLFVEQQIHVNNQQNKNSIQGQSNSGTKNISMFLGNGNGMFILQSNSGPTFQMLSLLMI